MARTNAQSRRSSSRAGRTTANRATSRSSARRTTRRSTSAGRASASSRASRPSTSRSSRSSAARKSSSGGSKGYGAVKNQLEQKIDSLRQIKAQAEGSSGKSRPSPATLTRFANVVSRGGVVRQASTQAIQRAASWKKPCNSAASVTKALKSKFGQTIKAVAPAKNGGWLIAASSTWKGKPFRFGR